jgi:hypothetical protein
VSPTPVYSPSVLPFVSVLSATGDNDWQNYRPPAYGSEYIKIHLRCAGGRVRIKTEGTPDDPLCALFLNGLSDRYWHNTGSCLRDGFPMLGAESIYQNHD